MSPAHPHSRIWRGNLSNTSWLVSVVALTLGFAGMRVAGMLGGPGLRWMLPLGFVAMAVMPWVLLNSQGRARIGLTGSKDPRNYAHAAVWGSLAALICFGLGLALFGISEDNWYVSIANNYRRTLDTTGFSALKLHLVFTVPALLFSPIGEEIFFRGVLQRALEQRLSAKVSTTIECMAFGLVHLCHHGLALGATGLELLPLSGIIWVTLMFGVAHVFARLKARSGSLIPAIVAHMAFNITMNATIFAWLWPLAA